jgi:hypothetical protein
MKLSHLKKHLENLATLTFKLPSGAYVPENFHITEIGLVSKHFIDCGGVIRIENVVNFQLFTANDYDHRLKTKKLLNIISLAELKLGMGDFEIEVEYQSDTIGKYGLHFNGKEFMLVPKQTACLASDDCGIPQSKSTLQSSERSNKSTANCVPGGGCC